MRYSFLQFKMVTILSTVPRVTPISVSSEDEDPYTIEDDGPLFVRVSKPGIKAVRIPWSNIGAAICIEEAAHAPAPVKTFVAPQPQKAGKR